jgi:tetratricopeptide (TPR) repeat protein
MSEDASSLQGRAWELQAEGRLDEAYALTVSALDSIEREGNACSLDAANLLNELADLEVARQRFDAALTLAHRAYGIETALHPAAEHTAAAICGSTLTQLGELHRLKGDYVLAEHHLVEALTLAGTAFGHNSDETAVARNNLAMFYKYSGRFREARALYDQTLTAVTQSFGPRSLQASVILHNIGGVLHAQGEYAAAETPARQAWEISSECLGADDEHTLLDAAAYAAVLDGIGRHAESEPIYRRVHAAMLSRHGSMHVEVAAVEHNLAATLHERGENQEAETLYRSALHIRQQLLDGSPDLALTMNNLGRLLRLCGRAPEARDLALRATQILAACLPADHPSRVAAERNLHLALAEA